MTEFTIRTTVDKQAGVGTEFDIKTDSDSPTKTELAVLSGYLTPKAQKILSDWLAANGKRPRP